MFLAFRIFYTVFLISLVTISCFKASEKNEIQEINENAKELFFKLMVCTQNQTKCKEFDELTMQIESNFVKGNRLPEKNEQYIKLREAYNQLKFTQEENYLNFGEDSHLFQPRFKKLTEEEKKIPFKERFSKKYIGKVPGTVDDIMFYLQNYEKLSKTKLQAPNQILLYGSTGTGQNSLVKTIAEELELPIIEISAATFSNKYYGESARRIRRLFEYLEKREELTTVFIDEIDALAKKRSKNTQGEERGALTNLLTEIQRIKDNKKIFIFCATNDFEELDPALKSRFLKAEITDLLPEERVQLFKKAFADNGELIEDNFATRLAQVTNRKSNEFSEYLTTNLEAFPFDQKDWEAATVCSTTKYKNFYPW